MMSVMERTQTRMDLLKEQMAFLKSLEGMKPYRAKEIRATLEKAERERWRSSWFAMLPEEVLDALYQINKKSRKQILDRYEYGVIPETDHYKRQLASAIDILTNEINLTIFGHGYHADCGYYY